LLFEFFELVREELQRIVSHRVEGATFLSRATSESPESREVPPFPPLLGAAKAAPSTFSCF
jgi:hypothetical protein